MKALLSELKVLIHIGQHLNILNLLGAVTKNIKDGENFKIIFHILQYSIFIFIYNFLLNGTPVTYRSYFNKRGKMLYYLFSLHIIFLKKI